MANTTVTNVSEMLLTNVTAGMEAGKQKVSEDTGFAKVMDNAKDQTAKVQSIKDDGNDKGKDVTSSRTVVETPKAKEIVAEEPTKLDPVANPDDKEVLVEEVAEEVSAIISKITEVLDVSEEELTQAMEDLGISAVDLLNPVTVRELCMNITDTPDSISLLTNDQLYTDIKEIANTAEDALNNITAQFDPKTDETENIFKDESFKEAVSDALSVLQNQSEAPELQTQEVVLPVNGGIENQEPISDTDVETNTADANVAVAGQLNTDTNVTVSTDAATQTVTVEVNREADAKPVTDAKEDTPVNTGTPVEKAATATTVTETFKAAPKSEESNLKGNNEGFEHASRFAETEAINTVPQQTTVVNTEVHNLGQVVETVTTYSNEQADSIMNQVTESIRVNYTADTTTMEMQLHPASLGTVNMNIASNAGVITAHIVVENEAVRAAREAQLITLQETFNEQGMKVEAVEVAVANYDLNRGTGSDTGSDGSDRNSGRTGRIGTRRRINLNDLDEEDLEDLSDDEKLEADMMARSGNSVSYQA